MSGAEAFVPLEGSGAEEDDFESRVQYLVDRGLVDEEAKRRLLEITASNGPKLHDQLLSVRDLLALPDPTWIVGGFMPEGVTAIIGMPNCGKSFVAVHAAYSIATGQPWHGRDVRKGRVLYVAAEGGAGMKKRVAALAAHHDGVLPEDDALRFHTRPVNLRNRVEVDELTALLTEQAHTLVVIDTLSQCIPGASENDAKDMSLVVDSLNKIKGTGASVLVVHHTTKDDTKHLRGSSAIEAGTEAAWHVKRQATGHLAVSNPRQKDWERQPDMTLVPRVEADSIVFVSVATLPIGEQQQYIEQLPRTKEQHAEDEVIAHLRAHGSMTYTRLWESVAAKAGVSGITARRALDALRDRGEVTEKRDHKTKRMSLAGATQGDDDV